MINLQDIRDTARDLLASGEVRAVIGFRSGSRGMAAEPAFITRPEEADELVWDPTCFHNLALYLVEDRKFQAHARANPAAPIAVVAKGCDARAIVVLLQEHYFKRDQVYIIGVSCEGSGVLDERKLAGHLNGFPATSAAFDGDDFVFVTAQGEQRLPAREVMAERCLECREPYPREHNVVLGENRSGRELALPFAALTRFEAQSPAERWEFWQRHFERCIRCYACRSVCPMCFCDECVVDSITYPVTAETTAEEKANRVRWIERSATRSENITYHMTRAMHLAGRCVDCGECERVCPVNIPLRLLNNKMEREARERFGYEPGASIGGPSLVASFRDDDPGQFIR
ncbi:4Fe-4S ferredoxin [Sulfurimicrobium lacus]|uniref:4Fe-4S ferredoxin n=1 Tax=Sulfurimicrobium lacus TaxID=2715678 RepID=A0A6F8V8U1_9PROT|nr:4Fe-4S dicluster domain-containing protein [Sulfurimicrobium lacus]BCB25740.1 4Fe-4S ferredoxin [Sulfurimicrobium lacus]